MFPPLFFSLALLIKGFVDKLVLIDIPESSTKGGTMDLEIFNLPKVEVSKGTQSVSVKTQIDKIVYLFAGCDQAVLRN